VSILSARDGYRAWAAQYSPETAVSYLEDALVREFDVPTSGRALLDAGCGTGRRLAHTDAALAIGVDLAPMMLAESASPALLAVADVRGLPFDDKSFDVVWCRLVIGHLPGIGAAYDELARVCRPGGTVVVTDFHPDAVTAGHRRTFRDSAGVVREIEHYVHLLAAHATAATHAKLLPAAQREGEVGPSIRHFYVDAGKSDAYEAQLGQRIVLAIAYRKG
jgi:malonyl-CoA O-methyltransferase